MRMRKEHCQQCGTKSMFECDCPKVDATAIESTTVKLKNGSEEVSQLIPITMMALRRLMDEGKFIVVYELIQMCRDRNHKPWGETGADLKALSLASEFDGTWTVHKSIRNIVLSAVSGEGLDMTISDPRV